jgi:hypothetical protein
MFPVRNRTHVSGRSFDDRALATEPRERNERRGDSYAKRTLEGKNAPKRLGCPTIGRLAVCHRFCGGDILGGLSLSSLRSALTSITTATYSLGMIAASFEARYTGHLCAS